MAIDRVKHNLKDIPTHFYKAYKNFKWSIGNQIDAFECFLQSK